MNYRSGTINIGNIFLHITLKSHIWKIIFQMWFVCFFYNLPKFDIVNADVPFYKRGHNLETEVKLNKAQHHFSNEVSMNMTADFQPIPLHDARKRNKNVLPYTQFYFLEKKMKDVL